MTDEKILRSKTFRRWAAWENANSVVDVLLLLPWGVGLRSLDDGYVVCWEGRHFFFSDFDDMKGFCRGICEGAPTPDNSF